MQLSISEQAGSYILSARVHMLASLVVSYLELMVKSGSLNSWAPRPLVSNHKSQFEIIVIQSWSHHKIITAAIKAPTLSVIICCAISFG